MSTISKSEIEATIQSAATKMEIEKETMPTQAYNALLGYTIATHLSNDPKKTAQEIIAIWEHFPKSASAMRTWLWAAKKERAASHNSLLEKLMKPAK